MADGLLIGSIAQLIATIFDLGSFERLTSDIQNRIMSMASKLAQDWVDKQQKADYTGNSAVSSIPNRAQLETMLYQDNANDTHKFMRELEEAKRKDDDYYNRNKAWFGLGKVFGTLTDAANEQANIFNKYVLAMPEEWADAIKPKSFNKFLNDQATYYTRKQQAKWKDVEKKQQDRVNKFSQMVGQSHDRFNKSTQNAQNNTNNIQKEERKV